jgi:hypothetical protein
VTAPSAEAWVPTALGAVGCVPAKPVQPATANAAISATAWLAKFCNGRTLGSPHRRGSLGRLQIVARVSLILAL